MRNLTLENIAKAVDGKLELRGVSCAGGVCAGAGSMPGAETVDISAKEATSVVIDSRKVEAGCVFVATRGSRVDGHTFIGAAFEAGALGVICEEIPEDKGAYIVVENSFTALKKLAAYYRTQMSDVKIVGIVGSVGKTSTKELVASVLSEHYSVLKTEGNFNNEIGVPLTILRIRDGHQMAVVEMGISDFGEMDRLGAIVRPDAVVMTNIGPCHLEFLGDLDGVLRAKSEVFAHIAEGGLLLLNGEDEKLNTVKNRKGLKIRRFLRVSDGADTGRSGELKDTAQSTVRSDVASYATGIVGHGLEGTEFELRLRDCAGVPDEKTNDGACRETSLRARVNLPGPHMVMNAVAAAAVGREFGLTDEEIVRGIAAAKPVSGRSNLIRTEKYLIVDDCYNANPKSMRAAVDLMQDAEGRKVTVLGDMFELGEDGPSLHAEVGAYAVSHDIDLLVCVGELSENMYRAALEELAKSEQGSGTGRQVLYYRTLDELLNDLDALKLESNDTILVKASHGMHFDTLLERLQK